MDVNNNDEISQIDMLVQQIAERLTFPAGILAEMGGTGVLQLDLGQRGGADDPHDTAGIDPEDGEESYWWLDVEGGTRTVISTHGIRTDPTIVARWIDETARIEGCPATIDTSSSASSQHYIDTGRYLQHGEAL